MVALCDTPLGAVSVALRPLCVVADPYRFRETAVQEGGGVTSVIGIGCSLITLRCRLTIDDGASVMNARDKSTGENSQERF